MLEGIIFLHAGNILWHIPENVFAYTHLHSQDLLRVFLGVKVEPNIWVLVGMEAGNEISGTFEIPSCYDTNLLYLL